MTDHPILFSAPMIRALLDGRKTQTRRIVKWLDGNLEPKAKYAIGDQLWVRESWRTFVSLDAEKPRDLLKGERGGGIFFEADEGGLSYSPQGEHKWNYGPREDRAPFGKLRPGIFLPRWASRVKLPVVDVRVQRLHDISEADAVAEGVYRSEPTEDDIAWWRATCEERGEDPDSDPMQGVWMAPGARQGWGMTKAERDRDQWGPTAAFAFRCVWNSINGDGAWDANPFVVCYSFEVRKGNIDE